ncbi:leucyl/phenylalanyl-tRNA--protein transferase [Kribbella solani]|uniref:leucyl/phenylalanyl-tRNA--protein transferase n=1 Tax=Kribbella solani TaxID=236067 RepID=UPI0029A6A0DF|nr:leucyl/phenylalanyl-tRNA--protein transferase [Kribbella solani]MDX2969290.1 leucyl/phenylalanyl-tRNA--protein transferase [Kribbella solani]MDX3001421.1 leucyl/phenylalanyl-tRNA--protein transferase [Kribbella solani]
MPVEPDASVWEFPPVGVAGASDVVAGGADLAPGTVLAAYRRGLFPMPDHRGSVLWWSPVDRGVIEVAGHHPSRTLRRARAKFEIRVNTAFDQVIRACADPRRPGAWIDRDIIAAYTELHRMGWVHSVEAWDGDELAGGLYGVAVGGLFAGESMFHHKTDGSKAAVAGTIELLDDEYAADRVFDIQWVTDHLATLGAVSIPRETYVRRLARAADVPLPKAFT